MNINRYISVSPTICHGQPCFKNTRILVYLIIELLAADVSVGEIISDDYYPQLTRKHIQAALHYAGELMKAGEAVPFAHV